MVSGSLTKTGIEQPHRRDSEQEKPRAVERCGHAVTFHQMPLRSEIEWLLAAKRTGKELDRGPRIEPMREGLTEMWERENNVRELMQQCAMTRQEAEFAEAIESGEIPGDLMMVKGRQTRNK